VKWKKQLLRKSSQASARNPEQPALPASPT
jgi:hypothetical protein